MQRRRVPPATAAAAVLLPPWPAAAAAARVGAEYGTGDRQPHAAMLLLVNHFDRALHLCIGDQAGTRS